MRIAITGAGGQLGYDLIRVLSAEHTLYPLTRFELDVTDRSKVLRLLSAIQPEVVIHAAAFTDVDGAEHKMAEAFEVNAFGAKYVAEAAQMIKAKLVCVSTDFVFDGEKGGPYAETDEPGPLCTYGASKLLGEKLAESFCEKLFIVRTAWLFGTHSRNFVKSMYAKALLQTSVGAAADLTGSPTYSLDLSEFIARLIETDRYGIYHATNEGFCTKLEFTRAILEMAGLHGVSVQPMLSGDFPAAAVRPKNTSLDNRQIAVQGLPRLRDWRSALNHFITNDPFFNHPHIKTSGKKVDHE